MRSVGKLIPVLCFFILPGFLFAQAESKDADFIAQHFTKAEYEIPMRDGIKLFTSVYRPKDVDEQYPILMERTPYSCGPYGSDKLKTGYLGPNKQLMHEKYIFVYQDVRGRYRSEGNFEEMTPAIDQKKSTSDIDESSDTYDTIEWLLKHIPGNNGKVGIYGISYPGFYATASLPNAHPALKAVSPQAPVTDEFIGDDAYHNGAFFLLDNFDFNNYFQGTRIDSGKDYRNVFELKADDAYSFYLGLGPLKNTNSGRYFNHTAKIWDEYLIHNTYDAYWKARNIRPHLVQLKPAVLVVGGFFDAEDMFGAQRTYEAIEKQNPGNDCRIVVGPWTHGAWSAPRWNKFGTLDFGENLNLHFDQLETSFFNFYLKGKGKFDAAEATVFQTGSNSWRSFSTWPPKESVPTPFYLAPEKRIAGKAPEEKESFDEYISDPAHPVPYTYHKQQGRRNEYLVDDQRFAAARADVLSFQTSPLDADLDVTGRIAVDFFISTTGTDMDLVVKLIDVVPGKEGIPGEEKEMEGFQRFIRGDVFRCRFRKSFENPEAMKPGEISEIKFELNEISHLFKKGHRIMVQVQSSWFPIVDLNPQTFVNISNCNESDFKQAAIRVYHDASHPSLLLLPVLK
jgi:putative CocE/NonD family hydrolase